MLVRAALPAPRLQPYIARYWYLAGFFQHAEPISLLPDGGVNLLVNFGEGPASAGYGDVARPQGVYLIGAMLRADEQELRGEQLFLGVSFKPGAFSMFHRAPAMSSVAGRVQPFDGELPDVRRDPTQLAAVMDRFYLDRLAPTRDGLTSVIEDIEARHGRVRLDALAKRHAVSGRQLERAFERQLGITPKQFADLTRFRHAQVLLESARGTASLAQLALDAGYYDQSHMTRHFKRFTGKPPTRLVLSDLSKSALG
ncbi:MAG: helix-turn-helix domain-containing protein [Myxococcota bacterium]|nr:helix-turn-helix domain-containing protein [Myxococcota bacterium]